jgi:hypothetical protein
MLLNQSGSLLGIRHFVYPVGGHLFVIEQLEEGIVGSPMLPVGQERNARSVVADEQVPLEAAIEFPASVEEPLFYRFSLHFSFLSRIPSFEPQRYCVTNNRSCHLCRG